MSANEAAKFKAGKVGKILDLSKQFVRDVYANFCSLIESLVKFENLDSVKTFF